MAAHMVCRLGPLGDISIAAFNAALGIGRDFAAALALIEPKQQSIDFFWGIYSIECVNSGMDVSRVGAFSPV